MLSAGEMLQEIGLAIAYHQAGAHDAELRTALRGRTFFPAGPFVENQLRAYAGLHRSKESAALADTILRGITEPLGRPVQFVITGALELRAHGDSAAGARLLDMARAWYAAHHVDAPPRSRLFNEGRVFYVTGQLDSAESRFAHVARDTLDLEAAGYLALVRIRRGDSGRAAIIADSLGALHRKWLFGTNTEWRAAITLALGDKERAVQLLRQASREGAGMESWHYAAHLDALRGYPPFEELIRPQR
jgi:hypothetical protein